jgi:hypothetical protein
VLVLHHHLQFHLLLLLLFGQDQKG